MTTNLRRVALGGVVGLVALFAGFVWPTPYRDVALRAGSARFLAAREHRLTGRVDVLTLSGWRPLVTPDSAVADPLVARMRALADERAAAARQKE